VWEPACGDGAISKVLEEFGHNVVSSDLYSYGYGGEGIDFLTVKPPMRVQSIITNPPYVLAQEFILHALDLVPYSAWLLRMGVLSGNQKWTKFFQKHRPSRVYGMCFLLPYWKDGEWKRGGFPHTWVVWDKKSRGPTKLSWLDKPTES